MNTEQIFQTIEAALAGKTTEELVLMHDLLEADENIDTDGRMMKASISDVIVKRHGLAATVDAILDADETFEMTYGQAMHLALGKVAA